MVQIARLTPLGDEKKILKVQKPGFFYAFERFFSLE